MQLTYDLGSTRRRALRRVALRCLLATAFVAATTVTGFPAPDPAVADPAPSPGAVDVTATGAITPGVVPDGTCDARITAVGGAGASSASIGATGGRGAAGASISATFDVLPQQAYSGSVGGGGAVAITGGVGGGGAGGDAPQNHDGAGGGGRTLVAVAGTTLVVAGGGGGAGAAHNNTPAGNGGAAGFSLSGAGVAVGTNGAAGVDSPGVAGGGTGGQTAVGGAGGVHSADTARNGSPGGGTASGTGGAAGTDPNYDAAGGGGAGYTGGGGGASTTNQSVTGAGGGGGSSFVAAASPVVAATAPSAVSGTSGVQPALGAAGANGSLLVDWVPCAYDLTLTKSPSVTSVNAGGRITWTIAITNNGPDPMTRGDTITLTDTLPSGSNASSPSPSNVVTAVGVSGGSNTNMTSGTFSCTGVSVGAAMPSSTVCSRAYAGATGTPGSPSGGTRGLDVGETLTITYDQYIANTAACGSITNTATIIDRPTINTSVSTNYTGNTVTDTAAGTVVIDCYDLAVTKTVSPTPTVVQGAALSWTITVVNNGPGDMVGPHATAANPLVITDTFPSTGVGSPTLVSQTGSAGTCTYSAPTITCPGSLAAGQQHSLTFSQAVDSGATVGSTIANTASVSDPRTGDTNDSSTASTQVVAAPRLVLQKSLGGQARYDDTDQFTMTVTGTGGGSSTTTGAGSTVTAGTGQVTVTTGVPGDTYTLGETMAAGSASALGQYANSIACTNAYGGSATTLPAGTGTSFTLTPQATDDITCTITNTPRPAQVTIDTTSLGGIGLFPYTMTNLASGSTSVATTVAGTPTSSAAFGVTTLGTAVGITQTVPSGWQLTGITCVDLNSAVTGNTGSFGTVAGSTITVPANRVEPGADIRCTFTVEKLARLVIQKTANGGPGTFDFATTGLSPASFSLSPNPPGTPTVSRTFDDLQPGSYDVTETSHVNFQLTDLTCVAATTSAPGSTVKTDVAGGVVSVDLVAGADYTCTFTNVRDAQLTIVKTAIGGDETFAFTATGTGQAPDPTPSITTASGVGSASLAVTFGPGVTSRDVTITEAALPAGWVLRDVECTDDTGAVVASGTAADITVTVTPSDTISCNYTNERLPRVISVRKQSIGTTGTFTFTGGTNGLPANLSLDTSVTNPASSGTYELQTIGAPASITESVPANHLLTDAYCVDGSGTAVSTALAGSTLTVDGSAVVGGANITCTFVNTRQSAEVRVDKRWLGATVNDQVTIGSTGGSANPGLVSVADTANEVDAGTAVTVYAGETLDFTEKFDVGAAGDYTTMLGCSGATDTDPSDGLAVVAADDGASIVCTYTNSRLPNVTKVPGSVTGPTADGVYTANYTVVMANPGAATSYGALVDTPAFASNLEVTGASWTVTSSSGPAPADGSAAGSGPFTIAGAGEPIAAGATHTFAVAVTFRFATYTPAGGCAGPGTGLYNSVTLATPELGTTDNDACATPPPPPQASVTIAKTASPSSVTAAGQTIAYSFELTNTGDVTLTSVSVADPLPGLGAISCPLSTLAPGASTTCTASYTVTQADVDAGNLVNTATVTGQAPNGSMVTDDDTAAVTTPDNPAISLAKTASPTTVTAVGESVGYSFLVTNTGNVTLTGVDVDDPLPGLGSISCPATALAPGASTTCSASYTVTQADIDAGGIANTATATGTPPGGAPAVTDDDTANVSAPRSPAISLDKTASPATIALSGQVITYSFEVTNTGNVTLTGVDVDDPLPGLGSVSCPASTLAPGASTTCTATYTASQIDIDAGAVANTATATGTPPAGAGAPVDATDAHTVPVVQAPAIDLQKAPDPTTVAVAGQTVTYDFLVTNNGNVSLTGVSVVDPLPGLGTVTCGSTNLAPGASTTCSATYTVTQADVDAGRIDNTATAQGFPPSGPIVTDQDSASVTAVAVPAITIVKAASPIAVTAAGQTVAYSFVVTNTGNVTLTSVGVTDPLPGLSSVSCPATTLAPGSATTCTASYTVTQADVDLGRIDNTATATGTPPGAAPAVTADDSATVAAPRSPAITITKTATPGTVSAAGQGVTYSFVVTNTGNVTLTSVGVSDPLPGLSSVVCPSTTLAPGASTTCTASYSVTQADVDAGRVDNTATATGTPPAGAGGPVTDTAGETVTATPNPSITLVKSAAPNNVTAAGQTVTYTFLVTNTGNVTLTGVDVDDPLPGLGTISCPTATLAPGASTTCTASYTTTQADIDAGRIDNLATATGTPPGGAGGAVTDDDAETVTAADAPAIQIVKSASPTSVGAAGQAVAYSFLVTNTGNVTLTDVDVDDPLPGLSPVTCPGTTLAPGVSMTCTAAYTATQADIDAGSIANTATATGSPPTGPDVTDADSVTVTAPDAPAIALAKTADPATVSAAGEVVTYSFVVTNTGNVTLTGVGVFDPLPGLSGVTCPATTLAPGAATTCTASKTATQADIDAGSIANTATASGTPPQGPAVADADSATVTAPASASIAIAKSASPATVTTAGQLLTYSFLVSNTGNVTLTGIDVDDPLPGLGAVSCPTATLAPGDSTTCSAPYTVTQADIDAGSIANTATATGTPPAGPAVSDADSLTVPAPADAALSIAKSASPNNVLAAGQTVTYSFLVSNTGNVTLTALVVTDPLAGLSAITCPTATLEPGETTTCTATYEVTQGDVDAGSIDNTASASASPPTGPAVGDTDTETVTAVAGPAIQVVKSALPAAVSAAGQNVDYTFLVTNTGNVTLTAIDVADPLPGLSAITCPGTVLAPGASMTCAASYVATQADVDAGRIDNLATATGTPPSGPAVTDADTVSVPATATPGIDLDKSAAPATVNAAGDVVTYSFVVTNTGNVTLTAVDVADPLPGLSAITCPAATLAPAAAMTCTATYDVTQGDVDAGRIDNAATATGTPPTGPDVSDGDTEVVTAPADPDIAVTKSASPATVSAAGQTVVYSFLVTNTGNTTLVGVGVADPLPGLSGVTCPTTTLAPGASATCTATYVATQTDVDDGSIDNTATASAFPPGGIPVVTATGSETVNAAPVRALSLVKSATPNNVTAAGESVAYAFVVTNTGTVTLTDLEVTDPLPGLSAVTCPTTTLAPGAAATCTATYTTTAADLDAGRIDNTATATALPPGGFPVGASDSASVTATASPAIQVVKSASPGTVAAAGEVVAYDFVVTNTGNVTLTGVDVDDPLPGLSTVTCPGTTLAAGAAMTCTATYTVTQADVDAGSIVNTATVTGTPPAGPDVTDLDTETVTALGVPALTLSKSATPTNVTTAGQVVTYSFLVTNTGNVTLTGLAVSDPLPGLSAVDCPVSSLAPGAATTCTASYTATQADVDAGSIVNTAVATGTPPTGPAVTGSDTATVTADVAPAIDLLKSADPMTVDAAGDIVTYSFAVTNTGTTTLAAVAVDDPLPGLSAVTCPTTTLDPGETTTCTATYEVTQGDVDAGRIDNIATVTGTPPAGGTVTDVDTATVASERDPAITLEKSASPTVVDAVGDVVTFEFVATNTGNVTLEDIEVTDPLPGLSQIDCGSFDGTLGPGETTTCTATYEVTAGDAAAGTIHNQASVTGTADRTGATVTSGSAVDVEVIQEPSLRLDKSVSPDEADPGQTVTYTFVVTNDGEVPLRDVVVSDPLPGIGTITCTGFDGRLDPGESVTCTAPYVVPTDAADGAVITNRATVTGQTSSGTVVDTDDTVDLLVDRPGGTLPFTGAGTRRLVAIALGFITGGWLLLVATRRKEQPA